MRGGRRRLCSPTPRTTNSAVATIAAGHSTFATATVGRSVGRSSAVVGAAFTIWVRPTDGPTAPSRSSFQVVEVELVAHLPTDWKEGERERGREGKKEGSNRVWFEGPTAPSPSLFQGKNQEVK